ncbi:Heat shock protein beta-11 [Gryllus bimaculatus]|nr:Heat shock protein beta-11 [Gryllus bimaculatus]
MSSLSNDSALNINGSTISFATSTYEGLEEPNKMIDGQRTTYWATSGLYPQQFTLTFPKLISVNSIKVRCYMVRLLQVEKCDAEKPGNFSVVCEKELDPTDVEHQIQPLYEGQLSAHHIRFTILSGYDHICAIYKIEVEGSDSHSEGNVQREFSVDEFGRIGNRRDTEWASSPKKQIPFASSMDTLQEFEEAPVQYLNNRNGEDDDDESEDNNNENSDFQQINDFLPVSTARSPSELPTSTMQVPLGSPSIISQRSPSLSLVGNSSEVRRPSTAQRSSTGRNSIMKKTKLEMFTESEEVSSGEEF